VKERRRDEEEEMSVARRVSINSLAESVYRHLDKAIICVNVFFTTATAVTAMARNRRMVIVETPKKALAAARWMKDPMLAVETTPCLPAKFDDDANPIAMERRNDVSRPLMLANPTARLLGNTRGTQAVYLAYLPT
jgi:hypothetical protein